MQMSQEEVVVLSGSVSDNQSKSLGKRIRSFSSMVAKVSVERKLNPDSFKTQRPDCYEYAIFTLIRSLISDTNTSFPF